MKRFICLFICFFVFVSAFSQKGSKEKKKKIFYKDRKYLADKNILKISPISLYAGFIPVSLEHKLSNKISVQLTGGITVKDFFKRMVQSTQQHESQLFNYHWSDGAEYRENLYSVDDFSKRKTSIGYYFSGEIRFYPEKDALGGAFIGLTGAKAKYNLSSPKILPDLPVTSSVQYSGERFKEHDNIFNFLFSFGSQKIYKKFSIEYAGGLGFRQIKSTRYIYGLKDYPGAVSSLANRKYIDGYVSSTKNKAGFDLSIKFGYHF